MAFAVALAPVCVKYVDASVMVIVIVPAVASTFKFCTVENRVLAEAIVMSTLGFPVKIKLPPVADLIVVVEMIETVRTDDEEKTKLESGVVIELPAAESRFDADRAPVTVTAFPLDVIVDEEARSVT